MAETHVPWPAGAATGIGSLPGRDPGEALRFVAEELPDLPHLPELPDRGPGADLTGRGGALLAGMHVDLQPSGWRLVPRSGADERRAVDLLARDLDAFESGLADFDGVVKIQVVGPLTLAASLQLPRGGPVLADQGARRDLAEALAAGVGTHCAEVRRRLPRAATVLLQLDEPLLPAVLAGRVPTASGFGAVGPLEEFRARSLLGDVVTAADVPVVVHCCAAAPPLPLIVAAGARALSVDAAMLSQRDDEALGAAIEAGVGLWLGLVPALGPGVAPTVARIVAPARSLWRRLGLPAERLATHVVVTPACGLAGASPGWVHTALRLSRQAGRVLADAPQDVHG